MFKQLSIRWYLYKLDKKYKQNDKWIISIDFIMAVIKGFNPKWIHYSYKDLLIREIAVYSLTFEHLIETMDRYLITIEKNETITTYVKNGNYSKMLVDLLTYFTDRNKLQNDPILIEEKISELMQKIYNALEKVRKENSLQYNYYIRQMDPIFNDVLEVYWGFIQLSSKR